MSTYVVRIDRDDMSRTYKGPMPLARAAREAAAWRAEMPHYDTAILHAVDTREDRRDWARATKNGARYYPAMASSTDTYKQEG